MLGFIGKGAFHAGAVLHHAYRRCAVHRVFAQAADNGPERLQSAEGKVGKLPGLIVDMIRKPVTIIVGNVARSGGPDLIIHNASTDAAFDIAFDRISATALAQKMPSFASTPTYVEYDGLVANGPSRKKLFLRAAYYGKKIFDGVNPGELPVGHPTQIELCVNRTTAKALGLAVPPTLPSLADKGIG
jgi:ABC-type uncharacterized transport system substrate-binding protein